MIDPRFNDLIAHLWRGGYEVARLERIDALAAYWPSLEDVPNGVDVFPDLPIHGAPD